MFVGREHSNHIVTSWPYALILLCKLMHLFHGGNAGRS
ncbi:DUF2933 domain-containing protein [Cupriavidus basilensis]